MHIDSSIQGDGSASRDLSGAVVRHIVALDPAIDIAYRDLAVAPLPHVDLARLASAEGAAVLDEFLAADVIVIGAPMYNFAMPSQLKAWFDHIMVADKTFHYADGNPRGLVGGKHVIVAHTRGGLYGKDSPMAGIEHTESHIRALLGFIGITDPHFILAEGLAFGPDQRNAAIRSALDAVTGLNIRLAA
nr:NAD(P)H-dependent oxidoreductase [Sphingobium sp. BYY-5]